jgi:L-ascorbate metabolism protein UlaG (beta-lactamase superfamily)
MAIQQQLDTALQQQRDDMEKLLKNTNHMKIKKIGHCCLIIETKGIRIMTDPGIFTTAQDEEKNIDIILITHEHADHFHVGSLKKVMATNPEATVITNTAVGKLLDVQGIAYEVLEHGGIATLHDISFEGYGHLHAPIYKEFGMVQNTGFFIDDTLFYPGDAFINPEKPIAVLALPVAAPWLKLSEVVEYAIALKPTRAFPVHDAIMKSPAMLQEMLTPILAKEDIEFIPLNEGNEHEF